VIAGWSVSEAVSQAIHNTAGSRAAGGARSRGRSYYRPADYGAGNLLPSGKSKPSSALWAARATWIGGKEA
jgi:hypothetical protein